MFTTSEFKGHPVVTVGQIGGRSFTFGKAKIGAILANLAEVQQWYNEQTNAETFVVITCHECGADWAWASDMPNHPYKPETPIETLCNACKDANRELVGRYPLAGVELLDLNSVLQLPAGEPKTTTPAKEARPRVQTKEAQQAGKKIAEYLQRDSMKETRHDDGTIEQRVLVTFRRSTYNKIKLLCAELRGKEDFIDGRTTGKYRLNWHIKHISYLVLWDPHNGKADVRRTDYSRPDKAEQNKPRKKSGLQLAVGTMGPVAPKRKGQMFSDRETLGPKHQGNAALIEHGQPLELKVQDPRTDEEREADQRKAEEAQNYTLPGMGDKADSPN